MSTLAVVEEILRETQVPMSVRQIVEYAGGRLPTKSKTPDTVVARDLSMDIKKKGEASLFARTAPGRYTLREVYLRVQAEPRADGNGETPRRPAAAGNGHGPSTAPRSPATSDRADGHGGATLGVAAVMKAERAAPLSATKPAGADGQVGSGR